VLLDQGPLPVTLLLSASEELDEELPQADNVGESVDERVVVDDKRDEVLCVTKAVTEAQAEGVGVSEELDEELLHGDNVGECVGERVGLEDEHDEVLCVNKSVAEA
jgi:hypothetical protein